MTDPTPRRSSKGLRSSFRRLSEEKTGLAGSEREIDDKGAQLTNRGSRIAPDHLSRKSSEGLRWISKLEEEETELRGSAKQLGDEHDTLTQNESERELNEQSELRASEKDHTHENGSDNNLEPIAVVSAEPEEPRRRPSLPTAPSSLINRQCLAVVCFSACLLVLLGILAVITAYNRWVATPTLASATPSPTSDKVSGNSRQQLDGIGDNSGCDSLFSFSHCANSDMFG